MQTGNVMNIVFSVDNNFVMPLAVTITTILKNSNANDEFEFFVLDGGISDENKVKINKLKSIKNFSIEYFRIDNKEFENCPELISDHLSIATYYRFKLPSLLNKKKALYLDCDILVKKSLRDLYDIDLGDKYAATIQDLGVDKGWMQCQLKALELNNYFNAGVLLLNLEKMQKEKIDKKCFKYAEENRAKTKYQDQCVLNAIFDENVIFIDKKYNFQYNGGYSGLDLLYKKLKKEIVILHFTGPFKPWAFKELSAINFEYNKYLRITPYKKNIFSLLIYRYIASIYQFQKKIKLCLKFLLEKYNI